MKSHSKQARLFGCSHVPYLTCHIVPFLLLGNIRRLVEHAWTAHYRRSPWQQIEMYCLFFLLILVHAQATCLQPIGKRNVPETSAVIMVTKLKIQVSEKYLVIYADLLSLKVNIKKSKAITVIRVLFM